MHTFLPSGFWPSPSPEIKFGSKSQVSLSVPIKTRGSGKITDYLRFLKVKKELSGDRNCFAQPSSFTGGNPSLSCLPVGAFCILEAFLEQDPSGTLQPPSARESHSETKGQLLCPRIQGANLPVSVYQREGC